MADEPEDDKKTDRVISMKEFLKEVPKEEEGPTGLELLAHVAMYEPQFVLVIHEDSDGRLSLSTNYRNYSDVIFALETVKATVIQQSMTRPYDD